ncbi:hypothetical protein JW905_10525, partial [bacterium]|nr:hypothetical protein [candidate division CSSED10-310 bacterium]
FILDLEVENHGTARTADTYIILDITSLGGGDGYYFWPGWSTAIDSQEIVYGGYSWQMSRILEFTWPSGAGSAYGVQFWSALLDPASGMLISNLDSVAFGFSG